MPLTIEKFWCPRLAACVRCTIGNVPGWTPQPDAVLGFTEAPLEVATLDPSLVSPTDAEIIMVSAPGAVGKSTLAKQIALAVGAIYVDLGVAGPVGDLYLTGGLARSGLLPSWQAGTCTLLIDGLDEARLKITQQAFEAFLGDLSALAAGRRMPVAVFGRTGAVQDALYTLVDGPASVSVAEIGFFNDATAVGFVESRLRLDRPDDTHRTVELKVISTILDKLRQQTASDGDRFAGYAPVLSAVAQFVEREKNPFALLSRVETEGSITLGTVVDLILDRDQGKLGTLPFEDVSLKGKLYGREEQLDRCVAHMYGAATPPLPQMSPADLQTYQNALDTWMVDHPFLLDRRPSSSVFDAALTARALKRPDTSRAAIDRELSRGASANPFLFEFYFREGYTEGARLPPEHVGLIYASLRAGLGFSDTAALSMEEAENAGSNGDDASFAAIVEIDIQVANSRPRHFRFSSDQLSTIWLSGHVQDVQLDLPHATVDVGPGPGVIFVAPVSLQCHTLSLRADTVIVERMSGEEPGAVYLEAEQLDGASMTTAPWLRGGVALRVSWPGCMNYPWTPFASSPTKVADPAMAEALRRLRRFVMAFRSHSKGALARLKDKLEHSRMTKGSGRILLDHMISCEIIYEHGKMYYLNSTKLGEISGSTYAACVTRQFTPATLEFVEKGLNASRVSD